MAIDWESYPWHSIAIRISVEGSSIAVQGETFVIKEDLKPLGGRYRGSDRAWVFPNSERVFAGLKQVVAKHSRGQAPAEASSPPASPTSPASPAPFAPRPRREPPSATLAPAVPAASAAGAAGSLTISQFVTEVESVLKQRFPKSVWLVGEIQNLSQRPTASYFQLAEPKNASMTSTVSVSALIWSNKVQLLRRTMGAELYDKVMTEGMQVRMLCQVRLYKDRGSVSLTVMEIDPAYSEGVLALQRQKVLKALRAKGVAELNARLRPAILPLRIGLISAPDSRAINDFLHQLFQFGYPGDVIVHPARMQGEKTSPEVCLALSNLAEPRLALDYIVITRGGGSAADLRFFDDESLGEAICRCPIPVIAAIGHHDDRSVAEEVAFRREKTPTAAAVFVLQGIAMVRDFLGQSVQKISRDVRRHSLSHEDRLQLMVSRIKQQSSSRLSLEQNRLVAQHRNLSIGCQNAVHRHQQRLSGLTRQFSHNLSQYHFEQMTKLQSLSEGLKQAGLASITRFDASLARGGHRLKSLGDSHIFRGQKQLSAFETALEKNDPKEWRKRGLLRLTTAEGKIVRSLADVNQEQQLSARLPDGYLDVTVAGKRPMPV